MKVLRRVADSRCKLLVEQNTIHLLGISTEVTELLSDISCYCSKSLGTLVLKDFEMMMEQLMSCDVFITMGMKFLPEVFTRGFHPR